MSDPMRQALAGAIGGKGAHVSPMGSLENLTPAQARKRAHPELATVWEQLAHIVFWQDWMLKALRGAEPKAPSSATAGWPKMPPAGEAAKAWASLVKRFTKGLKEAEQIAQTEDLDTLTTPDSERSFGSLLVTLADHNSYHVGQIVQLRKMMGLWPPPSGGCTW
jgi:uncharacterized damage-inducible protein DinB